MWRAVVGTHTVEAWVDDAENGGNGNVNEVNGSNNRRTVTITVGP